MRELVLYVEHIDRVDKKLLDYIENQGLELDCVSQEYEGCPIKLPALVFKNITLFGEDIIKSYLDVIKRKFFRARDDSIQPTRMEKVGSKLNEWYSKFIL